MKPADVFIAVLVAVFGETFGPLRLAGMVTVIGGIAAMLLARRPKALPKVA